MFDLSYRGESRLLERGSKSEHPFIELLDGTPVQIFNDANYGA